MEVRCSGCNQKYVIPDDRLTDRLSYFVCETCGETIALRPRGTGGHGAAVSAKDILEGIYLSFNLKNLLISIAAFFSICTIIFSALAGAGNIGELFSGWPRLAGTAAAVVAMICLYIFDVNLYLLSRNLVHRISTGGDMRFSEGQHGLNRGLAMVSVISVGLIAAFVLLLLPVALMESGWVLYAGLLYPVIVSGAVVLVLVQCTKGMLFAFIAMKEWTVADTIRGFFRFLARENVNIPFYMILIGIVSSAFFILLMLVVGWGIMLAVAGVSAFAAQGLAGKLLSGDLSAMTSLLGADAPLWAQAGIVLGAVFTYMLFLAAAAYGVVLYQTLTVVAVTIMESNPGRSVNRTVMLLCMALPAAIAGIATILFLT